MAYNDSTPADMIGRVYSNISLVPGSSVQRYAQSVVLNYIQHTFDSLFKRFWWDQFRHRETFTLDGVNGTVTDDISAKILAPDDIGAIWVTDSTTRLRKPPPFYNPTVFDGNYPLFFEIISDATKMFRILPITATGTIDVVYRTYPGRMGFGDTNTVLFDSLVLELGATWRYLKDDGSNERQERAFLDEYKSRVLELTKGLNAEPIALNPTNGAEFPTQWYSDD